MDAPAFDLQSHSTYSDGELPPAQVVARAARAGVELLALTDHDTVDGVGEALEAAADADLTVVPAAELSSIDGDFEDLHVCGYGVDHTDPTFLAALAAFRDDRAQRAWRMLDALLELGFEVDRGPLARRGAEGLPVGRPHLAAAVHRHPGNAARLRAEGLQNPTDVLVAYLIPGAPAYRTRSQPTVAGAIDAIHAAGGVAVWAHPFWDVSEPDQVAAAAAKFAAQGLDGIEAFYVTHTREQTLFAADLAEAHGLLTTGSSDFHGPGHPNFSRFRAFELFGRSPHLGAIAPR